MPKIYSLQPLYDGSVTTAKLAANSVTGAKIAMGSDAQGDILYYNGTDYVRLAAGTSGHFLKTQGAGANPIWAAATGSVLFMAYLDGETSSNIDGEIDTVTFATNDFAATDLILLFAQCETTGDNGTGYFRVNDGTNTADIANNIVIPYGTAACGGAVAWLSQGRNANTQLNFVAQRIQAGVYSPIAATMIASWITTAWTLSIRGARSSSGTMHYRAWIYKMKAS